MIPHLLMLVFIGLVVFVDFQLEKVSSGVHENSFSLSFPIFKPDFLHELGKTESLELCVLDRLRTWSFPWSCASNEEFYFFRWKVSIIDSFT